MTGVIFGLDQYLFLANDTNQASDQLRGAIQLSPRQIFDIISCHKIRQGLAEEIGSKYCHIIVPNKEIVLSHYLPDTIRIQEMGLTPVHAYIEAQQPNQSQSIYRPNLLRSLHETEPVFCRNDTHWTHFGALQYLIGCLETGKMPAFAEALDRIPKQSIGRTQNGDLGSKIGLPDEPINFIRPAEPNVRLACSNDITNEGHVQLFLNPKPQIKGRLLLIHDSTALWVKNHVVEVFSETITIHYPDFDPYFMYQYAPDYVVFLQIERFFIRPPSNTVDYKIVVEREEKRKNATASALGLFENPRKFIADALRSLESNVL